MISLDGTTTSQGWVPMLSLGFPHALLELLPHKKGITLYKYIAELADARQDPFVIPVPFFNVLNGGGPTPVALCYARIQDRASRGSELCRSHEDGNRTPDPSHWLSPAQLAEYYHSLLKKYPIISWKIPTPKMIGPRGLPS
ncbi:AIG_G0043700.mRNA.1.CDS.1 [Saccharomyces cerevisiae]|nr:AIG_G0043700.mRNA.1.CDS.1 [Saccharomyces cerevisiae]CAI6852865.1 AIG_G0043700.mRNA.1.CDS.1 [Saccharomyces cerevisiae]